MKLKFVVEIEAKKTRGTATVDEITLAVQEHVDELVTGENYVYLSAEEDSDEDTEIELTDVVVRRGD